MTSNGRCTSVGGAIGDCGGGGGVNAEEIDELGVSHWVGESAAEKSTSETTCQCQECGVVKSLICGFGSYTK